MDLTVSTLLGLLDHATLGQLCEASQLAAPRSSEARRRALEQTWGNDPGGVVFNLTRAGLLTVLQAEYAREDGVYLLRAGAARLSKAKLQQIAIQIWTDGAFDPRWFVRTDAPERAASDEDEDEDDLPFGPLDVQDTDDDVPTDESPDDDIVSEPPARRVPNWIVDGSAPDFDPGSIVFGEPISGDEIARVRQRLALTHEWSRPRLLTRVFRALGEDPPRRLRRPRFVALLDELARYSIEAAAWDGTPFGPGPSSPGIAACIRLRLRPDADLFLPEPFPGLPGEPTVTASAPAHHPLVVVPSPPAATAAPEPSADAEETARTIALLRLEFLTAVPSMDRVHEPSWPHEFVAAATHGLRLSPVRERLLALAAIGFVRGFHDPMRSAQALRRLLQPTEWDALLADFRRLNAALPEAVEETIALVHAGRANTAPAAAPLRLTAAPPPPRAPRPAVMDAHTAVLAAAPSHAPARGPRGQHTHAAVPSAPPEPNRRDLGGLGDMFND